jgi:quinol monooxygenase YgiN
MESISVVVRKFPEHNEEFMQAWKDSWTEADTSAFTESGAVNYWAYDETDDGVTYVIVNKWPSQKARDGFVNSDAAKTMEAEIDALFKEKTGVSSEEADKDLISESMLLGLDVQFSL